ncbi:MAG: hypothetical protein PHQ27_09315 [Victivallales bacterium]|nr:hypothetical protein [Victivallales bacterium]
MHVLRNAVLDKRGALHHHDEEVGNGEKKVLFGWRGCKWEDDFIWIGTEIEDSPSRIFSTELVWDDPDKYGNIKLIVSHKKSGQKVLIGYSNRGIGTTWVKTQIGDVLIIEQQVDTHFNEFFVIYPRISEKGKLFYSVLYATPSLDFPTRDLLSDHVYPKIKKISFEGMMTIELFWGAINYLDYEGNEMTVKIPIFYGLKKKAKEQPKLSQVKKRPQLSGGRKKAKKQSQ